MEIYKLNRSSNSKSGNCFDVVIDQGFFNKIPFLKGIESVQQAVKVLVDASPDAIQLTIGQAYYLQSISRKEIFFGIAYRCSKCIWKGITEHSLVR